MSNILSTYISDDGNREGVVRKYKGALVAEFYDEGISLYKKYEFINQAECDAEAFALGYMPPYGACKLEELDD